MRDAPERGWQARVELAALFRACVLHDLHEGIDNHCSLVVPDRPGRFLLNPFGPHWSELRARDLLEIGPDGTVTGEGRAETTAFALHAAVHAARPDANCIVHTHMPYATALALTEDGLDTTLSQNASRFHGGRYRYHREYGARFLTPDECAPIGEQIADGTRVVLLRNHGVLVVAETVAHAWWDLYFFERAAMVQVLAGSSGGRLAPMPEPLARRAAEQFEVERDDAPTTWAAVRRQLDARLPGYAV
ncbi:MAG: class II aldolase/adducin family protein [Ilumatobacteraceae bacterium]